MEVIKHVSFVNKKNKNKNWLQKNKIMNGIDVFSSMQK